MPLKNKYRKLFAHEPPSSHLYLAGVRVGIPKER